MAEPAAPFEPPAGLRRGAVVDDVLIRLDGTRAVVRVILFEDAYGAPCSTFRIVTDLPVPLAGCCWSCGLNAANCRSYDGCCADCTHADPPLPEW